jgi:membrane-associated phospholipid phosphatase
MSLVKKMRAARTTAFLVVLIVQLFRSAVAGPAPDAPAVKTLLIEDTRAVLTAPTHWGRHGWTAFGIGIGSVGATMSLDATVRDAARRSRNGATDSFSRAVEPFGNTYAFGAVGALYVAGIALHDRRARNIAVDGTAASLLAAGVLSPAFKILLGRSRPYESNCVDSFHPFSGRKSLPSGHTTESFAVASVIAAHSGSIWIKAAAFGCAGLVGYARVNDDAHFASDVVGGALLGTIVGRAVVRINERERRIAARPPPVE